MPKLHLESETLKCVKTCVANIVLWNVRDVNESKSDIQWTFTRGILSLSDPYGPNSSLLWILESFKKFYLPRVTEKKESGLLGRG